jgi:hypothetical protein
MAASVQRAGDSRAAPGVTKAKAAVASNCWSKHKCKFGCSHVNDCVLLTEPKFSPHPCPGLFGADGRWQPHCGNEAAS